MDDQTSLAAQISRKARRLSAEAAFRAGLEQRLRNLESELSEVKLRLNGLLFFLAGAIAVDAVMRMVVR
jgi:hypothetical protein